jgi:hypothetical protein
MVSFATERINQSITSPRNLQVASDALRGF